MSDVRKAVRESAPGVARVFGCCSDHGNYELPVGSIESGEVARKCPGCAPAKVCLICGKPSFASVCDRCCA